MTPEQYRAKKDDLLRRESEARARAQRAAEAVNEAKAASDEDAADDAMEHYRRAVAELENLMHETGDYDG